MENPTDRKLAAVWSRVEHLEIGLRELVRSDRQRHCLTSARNGGVPS